MTSEQFTELPWESSTQSTVYRDLLTSLEHCLRIRKIARKNTFGTSISWEDAAQTAHIKLLQAVQAGKFREGDVEAFYHWAATVARYAIIDLVRKEHPWSISLDQPIAGTNLRIAETLSDPFDALEALERVDLVQRAIAAIKTLDQTYPDRGYQTLWQGYLHGQTQSQIATAMHLTQGAVSKRWRDLTRRVAEQLGLPNPRALQSELRATPRPNTQPKSPNPR